MDRPASAYQNMRHAVCRDHMSEQKCSAPAGDARQWPVAGTESPAVTTPNRTRCDGPKTLGRIDIF